MSGKISARQQHLYDNNDCRHHSRTTGIFGAYKTPREYIGIEVRIEAVNDPEAQRIADQIQGYAEGLIKQVKGRLR